MLPDLADVALDEKTAQIIALGFNIDQPGFGSIRWQAWVVQVAAHAARHLVFLCDVVIELVFEFRNVIFFVILLACAAPGQWWFDERIEGWLFRLF